MAGIFSNELTDKASVGAHTGQNHRFSLVVLTSLFFMWGFITCLNDVLIPHLKSAFALSYTQAMLIQFCFFGAYFVVSLPAGRLVRHLGYKNGIVLGLLTAATGCALFYPAAAAHSYPLFLGALFVLASGVTMLQVTANPYVTALGTPQTASSRLTLTQGFNALGTTVAPFFGALLILSVAAPGAAELGGQGSADSVQVPYLMLAAAFALLALVFKLLKLPELRDTSSTAGTAQSASPSAWTHRHLLLGALGIFLYVGAEVSIGSFMISFLGQEHVAGMAERQAAHYVAYYWGGAMIGRFFGAAIMRHIRPGAVLASNALIASCLLLVAALGNGQLAAIAVLLVGLFNSVMFPTIFSLALSGLGDRTSQGSGILCLAIVGGALVPLLQGVLADRIGVQLSFLLPLVCYFYIAFYGLRGHRPHAAV